MCQLTTTVLLTVNRPELYVNFFKAFAKVAHQAHVSYVGTDRPHGQAASFEALLCFRNVARDLNLTYNSTVLDAGAGASSVILRSWFGHVITCDPNPAYVADVKRTCAALAEQYRVPDLGAGEWITGIPSIMVDGCFYDYGTIERMPSLDKVMQMTRHVIYVDDTDRRVDCAEMRQFTLDAAHKSGSWRADEAFCAEDEHSRWGLVLTKMPLGS